eukprot:jgi/Mesen1/7862/ME000042S07314
MRKDNARMDVPLEATLPISNPSPPRESANAADDPELYDLTTTLDPSHIIHLIRQLLPDANFIGEQPPLEECEGIKDLAGTSKELPGSRVSGHLRELATSDSEGTKQEINGQAGSQRDGKLNAHEASHDPTSCAAGHLEDILPAHSGPHMRVAEHSLVGNLSPQNPLHNSTTFGRKRIRENACHDITSLASEVRQGQVDTPADAHGGNAEEVNGVIDISADAKNGLVAEPMVPNFMPSTDGGQRCRVGSDQGEGDAESEEDAREEAGCVLWDLGASQSHADFLVKHQILDVLHAILQAPSSNRIREISLGILGNLACHPGPQAVMVNVPNLMQTVVQQFFVDDPPSLTETCRLLSAGLHSEQASSWVTAVESEEVLGRIMWIAANTVHVQLLEKSTELILAMVDGHGDAATVLVAGLLRLGLQELLTDLLAAELTAVTSGSAEQGDLVLDLILQITEALSLSDECAEQLAANHKLFSLACQVVRMSDRDEIGPSAITAIVLVANLLAEDVGLIRELSHDVAVLGRLLALLPGASDDPGARNALWSILSRMCRKFMQPTTHGEDLGLAGMAAALAEGYGRVINDLKEHREEDLEDDDDRAMAGYDVSASTSRGLEAKLDTASNMVCIMEQWYKTRSHINGHASQLQAAVQRACEELARCVEGNQALSSARTPQSLAHENGGSTRTHPAGSANS